jgi:hypothetical protein
LQAAIRAAKWYMASSASASTVQYMKRKDAWSLQVCTRPQCGSECVRSVLKPIFTRSHIIHDPFVLWRQKSRKTFAAPHVSLDSLGLLCLALSIHYPVVSGMCYKVMPLCLHKLLHTKKTTPCRWLMGKYSSREINVLSGSHVSLESALSRHNPQVSQHSVVPHSAV